MEIIEIAEDDDEFKMPFSGHTSLELMEVLKSISECDLPIEVFDAFLGAYKDSGDIRESVQFAYDEWDL